MSNAAPAALQKDAENQSHMQVPERRNPIDWLIAILAIGMALWHINIAYTGGYESTFQRTVTYLFGMSLVFLVFRDRNETGWRFARSVLLFVATVAALAYPIFNLDYLLDRLFLVDPIRTADFIFGTIALFVTWEASRRTINNALPAISAFFVAYTYFGQYFPGPLAHKGVSWERIIDHQFMTTDGLYTLPVGVFSVYIFLFVLFGSFLDRMGAADFYVKLSIAAAGRLRGGPAKAAIFASGLTGSITGSVNANVATTGPFTIPLMKRTGFKPETAAGIETAASTGGQIMPPIMGVSAFLIVEFTGISYWEIVKVSILPAILYFASVYAMVHLEARKGGMRGMPADQLPPLWPVINEGWYFLLPPLAIMGLIMAGRPVPQAGLLGIAAVVLIASVKGAIQLFATAPDNKPSASAVFAAVRYGIWNVLYAMELGTRRSLPILAAVGSVGIIMGVLYQTGLGLKFSSLVITLSYGNLFLGIVMVGLASFVLGMGLPTSAAYIVLSVMAVPALLELGEPFALTLMAAHLIVFWFSLDSSFTPPVCVPAYTAAGIAGAQPNKAAWAAFRTAKGMYIIPMLFAFSPLLVLDQPFNLAETVVTAFIGFMAMAAVMVGFLYVKIGWPERCLWIVATFCLFWPNTVTHIAGFVLYVVLFISQRQRYIAEHGEAPSNA
ncbi:MAG: TRAP transporter permease [Planctomycetota bacterium]|jgi:TRAP transporter 4TM/12TM fusion protein